MPFHLYIEPYERDATPRLEGSFESLVNISTAVLGPDGGPVVQLANGSGLEHLESLRTKDLRNWWLSLVVETRAGVRFFRQDIGHPRRVGVLRSSNRVIEAAIELTQAPRLRAETLSVLQHWEHEGVPTRRNEWLDANFHTRLGWLDVVVNAHFTEGVGSSTSDEFSMHGEGCDNYPGLFLSLGEAINGPGGYYGRDLDAMIDCLGGGFGPTPPFTLRWQNSNVAREALDRPAWERIHHYPFFGPQELQSPRLFDTFCEALKERGVRLVLE